MNRKERIIRIAGYFDGDGCVYLGKTSKRHFWIGAKITCCDKIMLDEIVDCTGAGKIYNYKKRGYWGWVINKREETLKFLKLIYPYSLTKKKQIKTILDNWPEKGENTPGRREELYWILKNLKTLPYNER